MVHVPPRRRPWGESRWSCFQWLPLTRKIFVPRRHFSTRLPAPASWSAIRLAPGVRASLFVNTFVQRRVILNFKAPLALALRRASSHSLSLSAPPLFFCFIRSGRSREGPRTKVAAALTGRGSGSLARWVGFSLGCPRGSQFACALGTPSGSERLRVVSVFTYCAMSVFSLFLFIYLFALLVARCLSASLACSDYAVAAVP